MVTYSEQVRIISNLLMIVDSVLFFVAGKATVLIFPLFSGTHPDPPGMPFFLSVLFLALVNTYLATRLGLYSDKRVPSVATLAWKLALLVAGDFIALVVAIYLLGGKDYPRPFILLFAGTSFILLLAARWVIDRYLVRREKAAMSCRQILLVGCDYPAEAIFFVLSHQKSWGHRVVGYLKADPAERCLLLGLPCLGALKDLNRTLTSVPVDEVIFALTNKVTVDLFPYFQLCGEMGIPVRIVPSLYHPDSPSIWVESLMGIPTICRFNPTISSSGLLYKRMLDIVGGAAGAAFLLLILPFVACAIKAESPGPVFFRQKRVGKNGRTFELLKFRSMYSDAEERKKELMERNEMKGAAFKIADDPRVTRVGRFLRRTSLDEVPQFLNVLRGEMSLVGTRPPTLDEVERYELGHRRRICIKPGITGLWQTSGRNQVRDFEDIVALDLKYMDNWRFLRDIRILIATVKVVLTSKGAH